MMLHPPRTLHGHRKLESDIAALQDAYIQGHYTSVDLVRFFQERIRSLNPYLEAVIEVNPAAQQLASIEDDRRLRGESSGILAGVPIVVKDNIATKDDMQTTAGSWALLGSKVPKDAKVISLLRAAGAVILGHTNMSEWASMRSTSYSTGYSPRGGQTRNPYELSKSPKGSSSGSAVAVAAGLAPAALGTETDTSIIGPASANGVVGIKPTVGLTSRAGVIPISANMDSVGVFGSCVTDAVTVLDAIAGEDPEDPFTLIVTRPTKPLRSYLMRRTALKGAHFGLPMARCWDSCPLGHRQVVDKVLNAIRSAGAIIHEVDLPSVEERTSPDASWNWRHGEPDKCEWTVAKVDAYRGLSQYIQGLESSPIRSVEDLVAFNAQNVGTEGGKPGVVPAFASGQDGLEEIAASRGIQDFTYRSALAHIRSQTRDHGIDAALLYTDPTSGNKRKLDALLFCDTRGIGQQYAAQAGYPIITIPIGLDKFGMPVGLSLQHSAGHEPELVKWASAIEDLWRQIHGPRDTPTYRNALAKNIPIGPTYELS